MDFNRLFKYIKCACFLLLLMQLLSCSHHTKDILQKISYILNLILNAPLKHTSSGANLFDLRSPRKNSQLSNHG